MESRPKYHAPCTVYFYRAHLFKSGFAYGIQSLNGLTDTLFVICCFGDIQNKNYNEIYLGININAIQIMHVMFYSIHYAVLACVEHK